MKRFFLLTALILSAAAALAGCAKKAAWMSLWSTPVPGKTSKIIATPVPTPGATPDESKKLFTTGADSMADPKIVVSKTSHTLELWDGDTLMARMKAALGRGEGGGPKQKSGDNLTPEGSYYICKAAEGGKFYKSLFISYPNSDDANQGILNGLIKQDQLDAINSAIDGKKTPPWNTGLGGEIAINGTGSGGKNKEGDWTAGNIALSDEDMDYLWKFAKVGTDVEIDP